MLKEAHTHVAEIYRKAKVFPNSRQCVKLKYILRKRQSFISPHFFVRRRLKCDLFKRITWFMVNGKNYRR